MKAIVYKKYGNPDVLHLEEIPQPTPQDNELLIKVHAVPVNFGDLLARNLGNFTPDQFHMPGVLLIPTKFTFGISEPKVNILGSEFSGEIVEIGKNVKKFEVGDQIFAYRGMKMGGYAEYICMAEDECIEIKPINMTYQEASVLPMGGITALGLMKKVNIQKSQKVLVNGASGAIGSIVVQIAKAYGAEVTGICGTPRIKYVKSLGADKVIDYTKENFTENNETYDFIIDILGKSSFSQCKNSLKSGGVLVYCSFKTEHLIQMLITSIIGNKKVICVLTDGTSKDLKTIKQLVEEGKIKSFIDKTYPMEQGSEAHRYVEQGHKKGNVVINIKDYAVNPAS